MDMSSSAYFPRPLYRVFIIVYGAVGVSRWFFFDIYIYFTLLSFFYPWTYILIRVSRELIWIGWNMDSPVLN